MAISGKLDVKAPLASVTPMHMVTLPRGLDSVVAATLAETLANCRGEDVVIDAAQVQWLGAQMLETLRWAVSTWKADGRVMTFANFQPSLIGDLTYFGVAPRYA